MSGFKRYVIGEHERGLVRKNRRIERVLGPGVYPMFLQWGTEVDIHLLYAPRLMHGDVDILITKHPEIVAEHFMVAATGAQEAAFVYLHERVIDILAPATRRLYWKDSGELRIEIIDISNEFQLTAMQMNAMSRIDAGLRDATKEAISVFIVPEGSIGLVNVEAAFVHTAGPGRHAFWRFGRQVEMKVVELRVQAMEVAGQEILTRDKVSLRINLSATYRIADAVKAHITVSNHADFLYRELQFALRHAVGARTLDTLLSDKSQLDDVINAAVHQKVAEFGIALLDVGIKDIILPGDMKTILNQVVEAEKSAQANVIRRREETAATRSLLNTAKLMDDSATLLRLKELEVLEKITEKVDRLTVFGGLESILKDTIRIKTDT